MKNRVVVLALVVAMCSAAAFAEDAKDDHGQPEPPDAAIHWARGQSRGGSPFGGGGSPNLTYHGGDVMNGPTEVLPIFWGTKWDTTSFVQDKITGMVSFYNGIGGTSYAGTNTEYTDGSGAVSSAVTLIHNPDNTADQFVRDLSTAPSSGNRTAPILAEVCKVITSPKAYGYYPVYVDSKRGHAGYCAWHSVGTCNGVTVQFAFFFDLEGDAGCDPQSTVAGQSQGLQALANVSGHELSEALTDPHLDAWFDGSGSENADKCAWAFGSSSVAFSNGSQWKVQGNWSNSAYSSTTRGYANRSGQKGCIDGGNYN